MKSQNNKTPDTLPTSKTCVRNFFARTRIAKIKTKVLILALLLFAPLGIGLALQPAAEATEHVLPDNYHWINPDTIRASAGVNDDGTGNDRSVYYPFNNGVDFVRTGGPESTLYRWTDRATGGAPCVFTITANINNLDGWVSYEGQGCESIINVRTGSQGMRLTIDSIADPFRGPLRTCGDLYGSWGANPDEHLLAACDAGHTHQGEVQDYCDTAYIRDGRNWNACRYGHILASGGADDTSYSTAGTDIADMRIGCDTFRFDISWFVCAIVWGAVEAVEAWDTQINRLLNIDTDSIFNRDTDTGLAWYTVWAMFRNIALAFIVIVALIMVISQAAGLEILDAYTIRKVLPRLLIATIAITLSWPLLNLAVDVSNDLGNGIRAMIYAPFSGQFDLSLDDISTSVISLFSIGAILAMGWLALLSFAITAVVAVFIAWLLLVFREIIIVLLIISAPIAIACAILPNTQKVWKLWSSTFFKLLLMFLIISAFIGVGRVFAIAALHGSGVEATVVGGMIALIAYFAPYFMIPSTFRMAGGAMAAMGSVASQGFNRMNAPVAGLRGNLGKRFRQRTAAGDTWLGNNPVTGNAVSSLSNRVKHAERGGLSFTRRGRAEYAAERRFASGEEARKALETEAGQVAAGDDDATEAFQYAASRTDFYRRFDEEAFNRGFSSEQQRLREQYINEGMDGGAATERAAEEINNQRAAVQNRYDAILRQEGIDPNSEADAGRRADAGWRARRQGASRSVVRAAEQESDNALGKMERGFGFRAGSEPARVTARRARELSDTAQNTRPLEREPNAGQTGGTQPSPPQGPPQPGNPAPQPQQPGTVVGPNQTQRQSGLIVPEGYGDDQGGNSDQGQSSSQPQQPQQESLQGRPQPGDAAPGRPEAGGTRPRKPGGGGGDFLPPGRDRPS